MNAQPNMRKVATTSLAVFLWLVTVGLGLAAILAIRDLISLIFVGLGGSLETIEAFAQCLVIILGLVFLTFVISTGEYHYKRIGQPKSWRLFGWTIAVEVSLQVLYYLL